MKFTVQDVTKLDPAALADELIAALGSNYEISTAGAEITTHSDIQPDTVAFQAVLDAHIANAATRRIKAAALQDISALEREQMLPRAVREFLLGVAVKEGAAAGLTEPQLYTANIGYRKMKDFNDSIKTLRGRI